MCDTPEHLLCCRPEPWGSLQEPWPFRVPGAICVLVHRATGNLLLETLLRTPQLTGQRSTEASTVRTAADRVSRPFCRLRGWRDPTA
jgi:hypothetical protein